MLKKKQNSYNFISLRFFKIFSNRCLSIDQREAILHLKNPKILLDLTDSIYKDNIKTEVSSFFDLTSYDVKDEKKNKSVSPFDLLENKKNKIRSKKKIRSKLHLEQTLSTTEDDLETKELSVLKGYKNLKGKKSFKHKIELKEKESLNEQINNSFEKKICLESLLTVQDLAIKLHVSSADIIKWLFLQGISATINQVLDFSISKLIAEHYSFNVVQDITKNHFNLSDNNTIEQNAATATLRAPVITFLGHVDHGKTSLLRAIRQDGELKKEAGNITQAMRSYEVTVNNSEKLKKLIFIDTPGHEAFVNIRNRGAEITDIVILVVSADDGLQPQTIEAIDHIKTRNLPFIIAINKIDKKEANINSVKKQLESYGIYDQNNINNHCLVEVSALTGQNIDLLISTLIKLAINLQLKSDTSKSAEGTILEAHLDKQKGPVAQLLVQNGTLRIGDFIVVGKIYGKVKAITDGYNKKVPFIESTALANILCFTSVPSVGLLFKVVDSEKQAKQFITEYQAVDNNLSVLNNRISLENINRLGTKRIIKKVNFIIKTDVQGSIAAIVHALSNIPQDKVQINLLSVASGDVSLKDIKLASTSNSVILSFNSTVSSNIYRVSENANVIVKQFHIIYDLINYVINYMLTFVELDYEKQTLGHAIVKNLFTINQGIVAGCVILDGKLKKTAYFDIINENNVLHTGLIDSVKRVKEDVDEVLAGNECGITCKLYNLWKVGDKLEIYELIPLQKTL